MLGVLAQAWNYCIAFGRIGLDGSHGALFAPAEAIDIWSRG